MIKAAKAILKGGGGSLFDFDRERTINNNVI